MNAATLVLVTRLVLHAAVLEVRAIGRHVAREIPLPAARLAPPDPEARFIVCAISPLHPKMSWRRHGIADIGGRVRSGRGLKGERAGRE